MPRHEFFLLGPFHAALDGEPLTVITSSKLQGLLAYLALGRRQPQPRAQVATLLWPERPPARASHNLRQAIYRLNKLLALPDLPDALLVTRHTLALNPAADLWFDAAHLQQTRRETAAHEHERLERCPACLERLETAVAHVRGPLLDGVGPLGEPFEEWLRLSREQLQQQALEALGHLAAAYHERGLYRRAQQFANRQLRLAPWHESAYRQLARALAAQGRRSEALAQFKRMEAALRDHLLVEPARASIELAGAIRTGAFAPRKPPRPRHNLPPQHTPFIGRASEMAYIAERLEDHACRLLTLVGPGGAGKSRLVIEAARAQAARAMGPTFVPLAATGQQNVATAILTALNVPLLDRHEGGAQQQLLQVLREQERLLILDNYEHLLPQTGLVQQILQQAPGVQLLVTSRQRLALRAEWVLDVAGLPYPSGDDRATAHERDPSAEGDASEQSDAVTLFLALARRLDGEFSSSDDRRTLIADLSRLLDGLPLALELAAALVRDLSLPQIVDTVARNLDVLETEMPDVDPRHRGLRAVFNHSWDLLREAEKVALCRLAVFHGDFTGDAANAVAEAASASLLERLVAKSLLQIDDKRYRLHAVLRQYAREKLQARPSMAHKTAGAHSRYYLHLLRQMATAATGEVRATVAADIENVRAAWRHATPHRPRDLLPALPGLVRFYIQASYLQEGHDVLGETMDHLGQREPLSSALLPLQAHLAAEQLPFTYGLARYDELYMRAQDALRLGRDAGDLGVVAQANMYLGAALARQGAYKEAGEFLDTARGQAEQAGRHRLVADCLRLMGNVGVRLGDYATAERRYTASLDVARGAAYARGQGHALGGLGNVALVQEKPLLARERYEAALQILTAYAVEEGAATTDGATTADGATTTVLDNLATTYWAVGHYRRAAAIYRQNLAVRRRVGDRRGEGASLLRLAIQDHYSGDLQSGLDGYLSALSIFQDIGYRRGEGEALAHLCLLRHHQGQHARSVALGRQAEAIARANHDRSDLAYALTFLAHAIIDGAGVGEGVDAYEEALALRQEIGEKNRALEPRAGLARLALAAGRTAEALAHAEAILAHLESGNLHVVDEPARVYLAAIRVLQAVGDPRAAALLHEARTFIRRRAALLDEHSPLFLQLPPNAALLE